MNENKPGASEKHAFSVFSRNEMNISGVREVISFDDSNVSLSTVEGNMSVDGEGIRVSVLDTDSGHVVLIGKINAVYYYDDAKASESRGFFGKLFK